MGGVWVVGRSVGRLVGSSRYESAEENARRAHVRPTVPHGGHLTLYRRCPTKGAFSHARKRPRRGRDIPLSRILPYLTRNGSARCGFSGWTATVIRHFASDITPRSSPPLIPILAREMSTAGSLGVTNPSSLPRFSRHVYERRSIYARL